MVESRTASQKSEEHSKKDNGSVQKSTPHGTDHSVGASSKQKKESAAASGDVSVKKDSIEEDDGHDVINIVKTDQNEEATH